METNDMAIGDAIFMVACLAGFMAALPALLIFLNLMFTKTTFSQTFDQVVAIAQ